MRCRTTGQSVSPCPWAAEGPYCRPSFLHTRWTIRCIAWISAFGMISPHHCLSGPSLSNCPPQAGGGLLCFLPLHFMVIGNPLEAVGMGCRAGSKAVGQSLWGLIHRWFMDLLDPLGPISYIPFLYNGKLQAYPILWFGGSVGTQLLMGSMLWLFHKAGYVFIRLIIHWCLLYTSASILRSLFWLNFCVYKNILEWFPQKEYIYGRLSEKYLGSVIFFGEYLFSFWKLIRFSFDHYS